MITHDHELRIFDGVENGRQVLRTIKIWNIFCMIKGNLDALE